MFVLSKCLFQPKDQRTQIMLGDKNEFGFQCSHDRKQLNNISQEIFSRIFKPLYIPLLAIVSALLLIKSKNSIGYSGLLYFKNENPYEYYNVGTGKGYSVMDVISSFEKVNNIKLNYVFSERREGDIEKIFSDNKLSKKTLNWSSKKSLDDMMRSAWNWETVINKKIK